MEYRLKVTPLLYPIPDIHVTKYTQNTRRLTTDLLRKTNRSFVSQLRRVRHRVSFRGDVQREQTAGGETRGEGEHRGAAEGWEGGGSVMSARFTKKRDAPNP